MKVYAVVGSWKYDCERSSEPYEIYASKERADAVCAKLAAAGHFDDVEVFEYELQE